MTSEKLIEKFGLLLNMERQKQKEKRDKIRTLLIECSKDKPIRPHVCLFIHMTASL